MGRKPTNPWWCSMWKFILPFAFLVPFMLAAATQDNRIPVAPEGCKWVYVDMQELQDGRIVKAVFLVCPPEKQA